MKVLLIGSGGREHALAWKLAQSPLLTTLYAAPGNPGIGECATLVSLDIEDHAAVSAFCKENGVSFVVVGPEAPLVAGIADALRADGIDVFGPSAAAAQLEASATAPVPAPELPAPVIRYDPQFPNVLVLPAPSSGGASSIRRLELN